MELDTAAGADSILVPNTCGLTTFTTQLFQNNGLALHSYPGEASSYRVLDEWVGMGVGAALARAFRARLAETFADRAAERAVAAVSFSRGNGRKTSSPPVTTTFATLKGAFTAVRWLTRGFTIAEPVALVLTKS